MMTTTVLKNISEIRRVLFTVTKTCVLYLGTNFTFWSR